MSILTHESTPRWTTIADDVLTETQRSVKRAIADVQRRAEDADDSAARKIRREPIKAIGAAACAGTAAGVLIGVALAWYTQSRR